MDRRTFERLSYRLQQGLILILHFLLLYWMVYILREAGGMEFSSVLWHFLGIAAFGSLLIRGCALWARYHS